MKEVVIKAKIDTEESVASVEKLKRELGNVSKDADLTSVEEKLKKVNTVVNSGTATFRDLKNAIKQYRDIAIQAGETSAVGQEALEKAAALQDRLGDLNTKVNNLAKDGQALQTSMQLGNTVINGYQALTGITAMLGKEQGQLIAVMAKMQVIQQTLAAIEQVRLGLSKESLVVIKAQNIWNAVLGNTMRALTGSTAGATAGMRAFAAAIVATGIGAIVVAIGLLIANFDKLKSVVTSVIEKFEFLKKAKEAVIGIIDKLSVAFGGLTNAQKDYVKTLDAAADAESRRRKGIEAFYKHQVALAQAAGKDTANIEKQRIKALEESIEKEIALLKKKAETQKTLSDEEKQRYVELRIKQKELAREAEIMEVEAARKAAENAKKRKEEEQKKIEEENRKAKDQQEKFEAEMLAIKRRYEDASLLSIQDKAMRELAIMQTKHERELEELRKKYTDEKQLEALEYELKQAQRLELENLEAKINDEKRQEQLNKRAEELQNELAMIENDFRAKYEKEMQLLNFKLENQLMTEQEFALKKAELDRWLIDEELKVYQARLNAYASLAGSMAAIFGQLSQMADKGSKRQKALAIAEIAANQAQGLVGAVLNASQAAATMPDPVSKTATYIAIYSSFTASLMGAVNKARAILKDSGGVPQMTTPAITAPNLGGGANNNRNSQTGAGSGVSRNMENVAVGSEAITKVIVVESDITQAQERVRRISVSNTI